MQVSFVSRPLNHKLWTLIYLCCFLLGICIQGNGEDTVKINRPDRVTYQWKLIENYFRYLRMRDFYGQQVEVKARKTPLKPRTNVPDAEPASHPAPFERRRQRTGEHYPAQSGTPRKLASAFFRPHHRRSHRTSNPRSPNQGEMHQATDWILRLRGDVC